MVEDSDMPVKMQVQAMALASQALDLFDVVDCKSIAGHIKKVPYSSLLFPYHQTIGYTHTFFTPNYIVTINQFVVVPWLESSLSNDSNPSLIICSGLMVKILIFIDNSNEYFYCISIIIIIIIIIITIIYNSLDDSIYF